MTKDAQLAAPNGQVVHMCKRDMVTSTATSVPPSQNCSTEYSKQCVPPTTSITYSALTLSGNVRLSEVASAHSSHAQVPPVRQWPAQPGVPEPVQVPPEGLACKHKPPVQAGSNKDHTRRALCSLLPKLCSTCAAHCTAIQSVKHGKAW